MECKSPAITKQSVLIVRCFLDHNWDQGLDYIGFINCIDSLCSNMTKPLQLDLMHSRRTKTSLQVSPLLMYIWGSPRKKYSIFLTLFLSFKQSCRNLWMISALGRGGAFSMSSQHTGIGASLNQHPTENNRFIN